MNRIVKIKTDGLQSLIKPLGDNIIVEIVDLKASDALKVASFKEIRNQSQVSWGQVTHVGNGVNFAHIKVGDYVSFYTYFLTCDEIGNFQLNTIKESNIIAKIDSEALANE